MRLANRGVRSTTVIQQHRPQVTNSLDDSSSFGLSQQLQLAAVPSYTMIAAQLRKLSSSVAQLASTKGDWADPFGPSLFTKPCGLKSWNRCVVAL